MRRWRLTYEASAPRRARKPPATLRPPIVPTWSGAPPTAIDFRLENHVATISINRPERIDAMDAEHYNACSETRIRVRDDPEIRAPSFTGT